MKKEAKLLYTRAVDSIVLGVDHFNRCWDRGRNEAVLIFLDRGFELLLKAIIIHKGGSIRDKRDNALTIGYDACLRRCFSDKKLKCLSEEEVVALQNLNSLRDAAQHYIVEPSEGQLYVYAQSAVTTFKRLTEEVFGLQLSDDVPDRMVVVSASPPGDFGALLDVEFADIKEMVAPGARRRLDAHAKLRTMVVLERSLQGEKAQPTSTELNSLIGSINSGDDWREIFPCVSSIYIDPEESGVGLSLRLTKNEGEAVHLVKEGAPGAAVVAVKRVNELDFYSLGFTDLLTKLKPVDPIVGFNKLAHVIKVKKMKDDTDCFKTFSVGGMTHSRYSREALDRLYKMVQSGEFAELWSHRND